MIKGIIMAGGLGSRLMPITKVINKHLLPVFNKPLIYYPISVLLLAGIKDILIITKEEDCSKFKKLLGDGSHLGIKISYKFQKKPGGIPEGILLSENFIGKNKFIFALGDNIFFGEEFSKILNNVKNFKKGCILFTSRVNDPKRFGILYKDKKNKLKKIIEKPKKPKNNYLYVFNKSDIKNPKNNYDLYISAKENINIEKLKDLVYKKLVGDFSVGEVLLTSKRQLSSVLGASKHLEKASLLLKNKNSLELVVEDLNLCVKELDKITKKTTRDDILNSVFSSFCVGK